MKSASIQKYILFTLLLGLGIGLTACKKIRIKNRVEGVWDVKALYISGSDNLIGSFYDSYEMDFQKYKSNEGLLFSTAVWAGGDSMQVSEGTYVINGIEDEIDWTFTDSRGSGAIQFKVRFNDDSLIMRKEVIRSADEFIIEALRK